MHDFTTTKNKYIVLFTEYCAADCGQYAGVLCRKVFDDRAAAWAFYEEKSGVRLLISVEGMTSETTLKFH